MAATKQRTAAFMAKVLAPLPAGEAPADCPKFRRQIVRDMAMAWQQGMQAVHVAKAVNVLAWNAFRKDGQRFLSDGGPLASAVQSSERLLRLAKEKQALIPAATIVHLRWKRRELRFCEVSPQITAVLEADARRLETAEGR